MPFTDLTTSLAQFLTLLQSGSAGGVLVGGGLGNVPTYTLSPSLASVALQAGTAASPPLTIGDTSGFYWLGSNNLGASINGVGIFDWNASRVNFAQSLYLSDGTTSIPSLARASQTGCGLRFGGSNIIDLHGSSTSPFVRFQGSQGITLPASLAFGFASSGSAAGSVDTTIIRGGAASQYVYGNNVVAGGLTSVTTFIKAYSGIADNTATATMTITVPNAAHSASWRVTIAGSLGAGGAIGANEATGTQSYDIAIARTAGVNAVGTVSTAYGTGNASVAGAATITCTAALSTVSGAVGATNTFTLNVTIAHGTGSSTNHTAVIYAQLINANTSGITLS